LRRPLGRKLYYSIGEVSELTQLQPYTLRAWEKEFSCLRPRRVRGKNRAYRERDIGIILLVKRLLYEERYSTRGVRQKLKKDPDLIQRAVEAAAKLVTATQGNSAPAREADLAEAAALLSDEIEVEPPPPALPADGEVLEEQDHVLTRSLDTAEQGRPGDSTRQLRDWVEELEQDLHAVIKLLT